MLVVSHSSPAARVLDQIGRGGAVLRDDLVESTELSAATVSRVIATLVDAHLVRPRPDLARVGATGRPSIPLQLDSRRHSVIGVHLGRTRTTVALADVRGRIIASIEVVTPPCELAAHLTAAIRTVRSADRLLISVGIVAPWTDLGLDREALAGEVSRAVGVEIRTADHITAAAAAEHAVGARGAAGMTAYVYARDTIGFAVVQESAIGTVISPATRLTHFPIGSAVVCPCRAVGCLEATASDLSIARRAVADGLVDVVDVVALEREAQGGSVDARAVLRERAVTLGRAAAFVRDMVGCDRIVLMGQGFTAVKQVRGAVIESFDQSTTLPPIAVSFGHHRASLQAVAASTIALTPFAEDPVGVVAAAGDFHSP